MIYYFYSKNGELKGLVNHRLVKDRLFGDRNKAVDYAIEKLNISKENPVGYIYKCRQLTGDYFNNAYKTRHPVEIIGCEKLKELL